MRAVGGRLRAENVRWTGPVCLCVCVAAVCVYSMLSVCVCVCVCVCVGAGVWVCGYMCVCACGWGCFVSGSLGLSSGQINRSQSYSFTAELRSAYLGEIGVEGGGGVDRATKVKLILCGLASRGGLFIEKYQPMEQSTVQLPR